jgi:hypothetical protein
LEAFLNPKAQPSVDVLNLVLCSDRNLIWQGCNTQKSEVLWTPTLKTCPLCTLTVYCSPTQTHSNIWAWCATSRSIWTPRLTQHFAHSRQARSKSKEICPEHNLSNRLHAYIWLLKTNDIPAGM